MRQLHRPDLHSWSCFDESRNIDFNGLLWTRPAGNVVVDPMPLGTHDQAELGRLGGVATIVITNSDHTRNAEHLAALFDAEVVGPAAESGSFAFTRVVGDGEAIVPGLEALVMNGSKTPGELALVLEGTTLITGDLVRGQRGGELNLLPDAKLSDRDAAVASVRRLAELPHMEAVLVGDGWPMFRDGAGGLQRLLASLG